MTATQDQIQAMLEPYRIIYTKVEVLDFDYNYISEIQGVITSMSFSNDASSDIRRTGNISIIPDKDSLEFITGNPSWLTKYIRLSVGVKFKSNESDENGVLWYKQGTYLPNSPSTSYSQDDNTLTLDLTDMMSKFTGMRNGQLSGIEYQIPAGSNIAEKMSDVMLVAGIPLSKQIINDPQLVVPEDIIISAGSMVSDIITQLRDIPSDWEAFFDIDGFFRFQEVPKTQNAPFLTGADDTLWTDCMLKVSLDNDFEAVKNYIEVWGKTHEIASGNYGNTAVVSGSEYQITLSSVTSLYDGMQVGFTIPAIVSNPMLKINALESIPLVDDNGNNAVIDDVNFYAVVQYNQTDNNFLYLGHLQARAISKNTNPDSPFFIGEEMHIEDGGVSVAGNVITLSTTSTSTVMAQLKDTVIGFYIPSGYSPYNPNATLILNGVNMGEKDILNEDGTEIGVVGGYCLISYNGTNFVYKGNKNGIGIIRNTLLDGDYDVIYSDSLCKNRADWELYKKSNLNETLSMETVPVYFLDTNVKISYTKPDDTTPTFWLIKSYSFDADESATETISMTRLYE